MTEEDTFNALKKTPFIGIPKYLPTIGGSELKDKLKSHGWELREYMSAYYDYYFKTDTPVDKETYLNHWMSLYGE